ncbi:MAG: CPBP family intramembrane glutamic endopeptidase [Thermoanaerobaculia bacterium]
MTSFQLILLFGAGVPLLVTAVMLADRKGAFSKDRFPSSLRKRVALGVLVLVLAATVLLPTASGGSSDVDPSGLSFLQVFAGQGLLVLFLLAWWLMAGRPPLLDFLALRTARPFSEAGAGICLGLIGWTLTLLVGIVIAVVLGLAGVKAPQSIPPLVRWIAALSWQKRALIVLCAMTVEEFHFRAFLQTRFGPIVASIFFLLAHGGYGEPLFLLGLTAITAVLSTAFRKTGATVASIFAHGTFDAIQLFVVLPWALKMLSS